MPERNILMAVTGCRCLDADHPTGLWLEEFALPYLAFVKMGYRVTVTSPDGGPVPLDPRSTASGETDKYAHALPALANTLPLGRVLFEDYDALFLPGGHGPLVDLAVDTISQEMILAFYEAGKPVAAVCHGPAALVNVRRADGAFLVEGKRLTAFTDDEEKAVGLDSVVPFALESTLRERGAVFEKGTLWQDHVVEDGNLLTGQNPQSSGSLALKVIDFLEGAGR